LLYSFFFLFLFLVRGFPRGVLGRSSVLPVSVAPSFSPSVVTERWRFSAPRAAPIGLVVGGAWASGVVFGLLWSQVVVWWGERA
jgi:hypothetical protein